MHGLLIVLHDVSSCCAGWCAARRGRRRRGCGVWTTVDRSAQCCWPCRAPAGAACHPDRNITRSWLRSAPRPLSCRSPDHGKASRGAGRTQRRAARRSLLVAERTQAVVCLAGAQPVVGCLPKLLPRGAKAPSQREARARRPCWTRCFPCGPLMARSRTSRMGLVRVRRDLWALMARPGASRQDPTRGAQQQRGILISTASRCSSRPLVPSGAAGPGAVPRCTSGTSRARKGD